MSSILTGGTELSLEKFKARDSSFHQFSTNYGNVEFSFQAPPGYNIGIYKLTYESTWLAVDNNDNKKIILYFLIKSMFLVLKPCSGLKNVHAKIIGSSEEDRQKRTIPNYYHGFE